MNHTVIIRHPADLSLLGKTHRFRRTAPAFPGAVFHLKEDQIAAVIPYDINFPLPVTEIALHNFYTP